MAIMNTRLSKHPKRWRKIPISGITASGLAGFCAALMGVFALTTLQNNPALGVVDMPAQEKSSAGIAAIVNNDVISHADLSARLELALTAANLPRRPEIIQRLRQQVQEELINETLQIQEAQRLGIKVSEADIDLGFERIAQQNGMDANSFRKTLKANGVDPATLRNRVRAEIMWAKVIQFKLRPKVSISEEDIDAELEQRRAAAGKPEYLVAEIFLPVDDPANDARIKGFAEKLVDEIVKGAPFPAIARQFSRAAGAANGGDLGWVSQGQMPEEIDSALTKMKPGQISPPIRSMRGYHIVFLRDTRKNPGMKTHTETIATLKQIFLPFSATPDEAELDMLMKKAEAARADMTSCDDMDDAIKKFPSKMSGNLGDLKMSELPKEVTDAIQNLPIGTPSVPLRHAEGIAVMMVCGRKTIDLAEEERDKIANQLGMQRLDLMQRSYLRDLRASAFIDKRV